MEVRRCVRQPGQDAVEAARALAGVPAWEPREIDAAAAEALLVSVLHRDLAYGLEMMPLDEARAMASEFVAAATPGTRFFTNTAGDGSWTPLTDATFDCAIIRVGEHEVVQAWVECED